MPLNHQITLAAVLALVPTAQGDDLTTPQVVLREGGSVAGTADMTAVFGVSIDDQKRWYADVDTDFPNIDEDRFIVRNGDLVAREGMSAASPPNATVGAWGELDGGVTESGALAWNIFLDGGGTTAADDDLAYFGDTLLAREGDLANVPGFGAGTTWNGMVSVKASDDGRALLVATIRDPTQPGLLEWAAVLFTLDGAGAATPEVLAVTGAAPAGTSDLLVALESGEAQSALADGGHVMFTAHLDDPSAPFAIFVDGAIVARDGGPSPVPGRNWASVKNAELDVNAHGSWVAIGTLAGDTSDNLLITVDGTVLAQEDDVLASISPHVIEKFGPLPNAGPIHIGDNGNVLFNAEWSDPDGSANRGLFLNDRLVMRTGDVTTSGDVIVDFSDMAGGYALNDSGEAVVARVLLADGDVAIVVIDVGPWVSLGRGLAGTSGLIPYLVGGGTLAAGEPVALSMNNARPGVATTLVVGFSKAAAPFKGGILVPAPDILFAGLPVDGTGHLAFSAPMPAGAPSGFDLYFQFWHPDPQGYALFAASNAIVGTTP